MEELNEKESYLKYFVSFQTNNVKPATFTITPLIAKWMLDNRNKGNRPISKAVVKRYANEIQRGGWRLNGVPIVFDRNGILIDGQHRLAAVVESDTAIQSLVVVGVESDVFATYDCGRSRQLGQLIAQDCANYFNTAAVVRSYLHLKTQRRSFKDGAIRPAQKDAYTNDMLVTLYNSNKETFNLFGARAAKLNKAFKKAPIVASVGAAAWLYLVEDLGYEDDFVGEFFTQLYSEIPTTTNKTIIAMCRMFHNWRNDTNIPPTTLRFDYLVKAFNSYAAGKEITYIFLPRDGSHPSFEPAKQYII